MSHFPVAEIRSVELGTPDLARSEGFYTKVWGLQVQDRADGVVYLRASGRDHHVLSLRAHAGSEVLSLTFRVAAAAELQRLADSVQAAGGMQLRPVEPNPAPDGGTVVTLRTPEGYILRLIHGDRFHADGGPRRDFPPRISHVNLNCANIEATSAFFQRALGFCLTDRSKMMTFLRCNDDHHAVVLADSGVDRMNHIAFMMPDFESVMRGSGRMVDHGHPIGWGVGRHGPGDNIFAYFIDPTGFVIEYTAEVLQVDDTYAVGGPDHWVWPPGRTDHWGIAPPKPASVKQAQLAIRFASQAALAE
jgi:catechol 2,3-dioxygenase-like lactoylglutathione lyase family enzyme